MSWKQVVGQIAPTIGRALGGPLGGMAANVLLEALGLPPDAEDDAIEKQLASNPEQLVKLKEAELNFKARLKELDIDLEKIHADDRNSARQREIAIKDKMPGLLASLVTLGFFGTLGWMLKHGIPENGGEALLVMLGALGAGWGSVTNYYFGSSRGSKEKNELLAGKR